MYPLLYEFLIDTPTWKVYTQNELTMNGVYLFGRRQEKIPFTVRPHHHPDLFEFHLLQGGTYTFLVEGKTHNVTGGHVFITLPGELHEARFTIPRGQQFYWFQLQSSKGILGLGKEKSMRLIQKLMQLQHRTIAYTPTMEDAIRKAFDRCRSTDAYDKQVAENLLASFLYQLIEEDEAAEDALVSAEIRQAMEYMQSNLHSYQSVPALAAQVGLSESYFRTKFKKETGVTPTDYYMGLRIEKAKELLQEGCSVTETANALDFPTHNYFATVFRQATNMTPSAYKKKQP